MDRIEATALWTGVVLAIGWIFSKLGLILGGFFVMVILGSMVEFIQGPDLPQKGPIPVTMISASGFVHNNSSGTMVVTNRSDRLIKMTTVMCNGTQEFWIRNLPAGESETRNFYALDTGAGPMICEAIDIRS